MTLIAVPIEPLALPDKTAKDILDGLVGMPNIFSLPGTPEERRVLIASAISDPTAKAWSIWNGGTLCGIFLLNQIAPRIDALAHLAFFDRQLYGRRALIWRMLGKVFHELDLQRVSVEVPEHLTPLLKFIRLRLHFRYEGEDGAAAHPLISEKVAPYVQNPGQWAARLGSRRERAFWRADTGEWCDLIKMRLLRSEYETIGG